MDRTAMIGIAKDWGLALLLAVAVFAVWTALAPSPPSSGPAPDFSLADVDGQGVTLAAHKGEVVAPNFWATWCGPCRAEIPEFAAFHEGNPTVPVYGISVDKGVSDARLKAFGKKAGINYPILLDDGSVSSSYRISGIPATFIIDAKGEISAAMVGQVSRKRLEAAVAAAKG